MTPIPLPHETCFIELEIDGIGPMTQRRVTSLRIPGSPREGANPGQYANVGIPKRKLMMRWHAWGMYSVRLMGAKTDIPVQRSGVASVHSRGL